jgi:hypothetical protein
MVIIWPYFKLEAKVSMDLPAPSRPNQMLKTSCRFYKVDRKDISFLRFILEAYDGLAVLTTEDAAAGLVKVTMAPGCEDLVTGLIKQLAAEGEIFLEPIDTVVNGHCG